MILVEQLTKSFGPMSVLEDVSFTVSDGEKVGLVGPNGTGKSTLLELIAGMGDPDDGVARHTDGSLSYLQQDVPFKSDRVLLQEMWVAFADVTAVQKQGVVPDPQFSQCLLQPSDLLVKQCDFTKVAQLFRILLVVQLTGLIEIGEFFLWIVW